MRKIIAKRILPIALCLLMVVPALALGALAAVNESLTGIPGDKSIIGTERQNWASNGQGYHTSAWNYDRHSKYLNNGTYAHSYQYWQPSDPARPNGAGVDPTKQHVGFSFMDGYYIFDEVVIYANSYDKGYNNIKYTVEALILGEWVVVGVGYQDDGTPSDKGGEVTRLSIPLTHPNAAAGEDINTNNIRIWCSEYGSYAIRYGEYENKQPTSHDWWLTPCMQEVELMGVTGYRPEFDVPLNAYLVTNAALSGMVGATSALRGSYPGQAADESFTTGWKAQTKGAQSVWAEFDKAYPIDNVGFNVGGAAAADAGVVMTYDISIQLEDGTWKTVVTGATATLTSENVPYIVHDLGGSKTVKQMKIDFTNVVDAKGASARAFVSELCAEISDGGKCIFLADYLTASKKASSATGNLACYGTAYASSTFTYAGIANVANIIDGNVAYDDHAWIANDYLKGTYVGVTLRESHAVTKVALYFSDLLGGENGEHVFAFDLQLKQGDEFVTVASGTSYDAENKIYTAVIVFEEGIETDDVRVVFTSDAQTFPYLKEIEVFEGDFIYSSYLQYTLDSTRKKGGPAATNEFGYRTVAQRGKYFSKCSPIEYFNIALEHDVEIDWLG